MKLKNWSAKRSGASITVTGVDVDVGKIVRVKAAEIAKPEGGSLVATLVGGGSVELV